MNIDPHTIQMILMKVREQLRCPQCSRKVEASFNSLKVLQDTFAVLQMKCRTCDAYIMLHAAIATTPLRTSPNSTKTSQTFGEKTEGCLNVSTELTLTPKEIRVLRESIKTANGSFSRLFEGNATKN